MQTTEGRSGDPHGGARVLGAGAPVAEARAAMLLVHGRGAGARDILGLAAELERPELAFVAPEAVGLTWYPYSFLAPLERNEPYLSSALRLLARVLGEVERAGIPAERVILLGFSQGACLSTEFAARNPRRYGGVAALTGGLIGPEGTPRDYVGSLDGTPVFLGTSDPDPHVPVERVEETERVLAGMGGVVTRRVYPGMGHTVNRDELDQVRAMVDALLAGA